MSNTHGGANRGQGRKPRPLPKWMAALRCSEQDWQVIQSIIPEQRAEILVAWAQANIASTGQERDSAHELALSNSTHVPAQGT